MRINLLILGIVLLVTLYNSNIQAQKIFSVTIEFPSQLMKENISISYDNGIDEIELKPAAFAKNRLSISGEYYAKYASLEIQYPGKEEGSYFTARFFLGDAPARITFMDNKSEGNPLKTFELYNAYSHTSMGEGELTRYISKEQKEAITFLDTHQSEMNDSLLVLAREKFDKLQDKRIEFLTQNPGLYYNFWFFRTGIVYDYKIASDSLYKIFELFPDSLKKSREGERIVQILRSSKLKKGQVLPDFTTSDTTGRSFSLSDYRGKYVLLDFWASWCGPCVAEMPRVMEIRNKFPEGKLAMIFISSDDDTLDFQRAVRKYNIQGKHAFLTKRLLRQYSIQAIPVLYVIDPEGQVIYSLYEEQDNLQSLNKILEDRL